MTSYPKWKRTLLDTTRYHYHYVKSVQIRSYFWSVFSSVFSCIQFEYRKIRTRNNSLFRPFSRSGISKIISENCRTLNQIKSCNNLILKSNFFDSTPRLRFNFSSKKAYILAHVYVKNIH